jgi:large repetitive protein
MNTSLPIKRAFYAFFVFLLFSSLTSILYAQTCPNNLLSNGSLENGTFSATTVSGITTQMTTYGGSTSVFLPFTASGVWDHPISNFVANTGYWVDASTNGGSGAKDLNRLFVIPANTGSNRCLWPTNSTGFTHTAGNCYRICFWAAQFDPASPNNASLNSKINFEVLDQWGTNSPATVSNFSVTPASTDVGSNYTISTFDLPASTNVKTITGATYTGASGQVVDWKTLNWQYICLDFTPLLANGRVEIYLSTTNTAQNGVALDGICATSGNCGVTCTPPVAPAVANTNRCGIGSLTATISTTCTSGSTLKIFSNSNLTTDVTSSFTIASGSVTSGSLNSTTNYYAACQSTINANCKSTGDLFTLTINTEPAATAAATQPSCNGANTPNNGAITLTGGSGLRYQYSAGATFNSGSATPSSITAIPSGGVITSSLPNTSGDYTVRIYHTSDNTCYVDRKVTIMAANCCTKPYAGADKYLACTGTTLTTTTTLAGFSPSGGTWTAQTGNPANANITNTGAVTGMTKAGIYKFIYTVTGNCSDTVAVTVGSCACNTTCFRTLGNANNCDGTTHGAGISYFSNGLVVEKLYAQNVILKECVADGTASITGVLTKNPDGTGEKFTIDFNYSGYSTTNPGPEPFHQNECATVTDFSDWHWYSTVTGTITSSASGVYTITRYGPATQIGTHAGEKFLGYGIGGWLEHSQSFHTGYFDFWAPIGELQCPCVKPNAGPDAVAVCQPTSTSKLTAVTTGGTWAPQANNPSAAIIDANGNISGLNAAGTYKFIYSVTGAGNTCTDTAQVVVNAKPKITDGTAAICAGESLDLTAKITGYATLLNPKWTINTTTGAAVTTPTAVKPTSNTIYVLVAQNNNGCKDTANVAVTVNPKPSAGNDQTLACANNILTKNTTLAPNPSGGIWTQIGNTPTAATINGNSITNMNEAGTYQFIYTLNGCKDTVAVTVEPCTPCIKPNAGPDQQLDCGTTAPTTANLLDAATGQKWKVLSVQPNTVVTVTTPTGNVSGMTASGTYRFVLQTQSDSLACRDTVSITVPNCSCPEINVLNSNATVCKDSLFPTLTVAILGSNAQGVGAAWFANAIGGTSLATGLSFKPAGTATVTDTFYVALTGTSANCLAQPRTPVIVTVQNCTVEVDLALKKSINTKIAQIGDVLTYTLKVWNESNNNATGVEVTDSIATTVQFQTGSFAASRGSASITGNVIKWVIGNVAANGDTVTLTYRVKATKEGVHFNTAEICKTNEKDIDSPPCNNDDGEDDIDRQCFTVPIKLCPHSKVQASISSIYTNVQWFKDGSTTPIATGNTVLLSDVGSYTYTATNQTCPAGGCCPIIIEEGLNCCPTELCIPYVVKKLKKQ